MRKPVLTIFYQYNPWHSSIGGIQTLISSFIKYAPDEFEIRLVGVGDRLTKKIGVWQQLPHIIIIQSKQREKMENSALKFGFLPNTNLFS